MQYSSAEYIPRKPEETVLYRVVAGELETFLARQQERDRSVPQFVEKEFRSFLDCGILARGFLRLHCQTCGRDRLLAFSCKRRAWCPSCGGRRMAETAAHLVDSVIPVVPVRQWVLSLPFALRYRMAYDARLITAVLNVFIRALFGELRRRARTLLGIGSAQCGAVTFVQRWGDALNTNPHFHCIALDGVYGANGDGRPEFHALPAPGDEDVVRLAALVSRLVQSLLERRGLQPDDDVQQAGPLAADPGLAGLLAHSVQHRIAVGAKAGWRVARLGDQIDGDSLDAIQGPRCAMVSGFSLHGNVAIGAYDRMRLERLFRYAGRPAVAGERLSELPDGRLLYRLKRPWRDGTHSVLFERQDFMAKLAVLVPAPRAHLTRYHGVLGPAAAWRPLIVPTAAAATSETNRNLTDSSPPGGFEPSAHGRNYTWAELMKRVFLLDVLQCERCGGRIKILAAIHPPENTAKILQCVGLPSRAPPLKPAAPGPTLDMDYL